MEQMQNIKVPSYAADKGKGLFAGALLTWMCVKCGKQTKSSSIPNP